MRIKIKLENCPVCNGEVKVLCVREIDDSLFPGIYCTCNECGNEVLLDKEVPKISRIKYSKLIQYYKDWNDYVKLRRNTARKSA